MLYKEEVYTVIGAAMEVYNVLGSGFLEPVYQEALEIELSERNIPFSAQALIPLYYKEKQMKKEYCADLICYEKLIVELKAVDKLCAAHKAQLLNYLHAAKLQVGVLINFGHTDGLEWKRMVV